MAALIKRKTSRFWYARWRSMENVLTVSTKVPIKGEIVNGIKESPSEARRRAQKLADAYEAADKDGLRSEKVKSIMSDIADEDVRETPSVRVYLRRYLASRELELAKGTLMNMKISYRLFVRFLKTRADHPIDKVRRSDVKEFISVQLRSVRRNTVKKYLTALSPAFKAAMDDEFIDRNPFFQVPVPQSVKYGKNVKSAFDQDEVALMLERLPEEWRSMVIFCLCLGGQRLGDLATLQWSQIDMQKGVISLTTGKTKRIMSIPIIHVLKQHILSLPHINEYVHPECARHYKRNSSAYLSYQFRVILQGRGIVQEDVSKSSGGRTRNVFPKTFHCLRATAATWLHTAGIDHALARELVGHDSEASHQLYIRPSEEARREALEKLGTAFLSVLSPRRKVVDRSDAVVLAVAGQAVTPVFPSVTESDFNTTCQADAFFVYRS